MIESEARYLDRIVEDCAQLLGPKGKIEGLDVESNDHVALRLRYQLGEAFGLSEGRGESLIAAHADLRNRIRGEWLAVLTRAARAHPAHRRARLVFGSLALAIATAALLLGPPIILIVKNLRV